MTSQEVNHLKNLFNKAVTKALAADDRDDWTTHLRAISNCFTQVCYHVATEEAAKNVAIKERDEAIEELLQVQEKAVAHDDLIKQLHLLLAADNQRNHSDLTSMQIFEKMAKEVRTNMERIKDCRMYEARYNVEKRRNERMSLHINDLSKKNVLHLMASRLYATELAALRQMMDLVRNASSIDAAVKSKLWDQIEKENRMLRLNTLWTVNRINSPDLTDAPFEGDDNWQSPPRLVILMREHYNQGLGLEITGGSDNFRPVVVTGKMRKSMADDDQLRLDDRILAIDGNFVTNTTTHAEVLKMLENESSKDFLTLIVSQFDPTKYSQAHPQFQKSPHHRRISTSTSTTEEEN
ncbi:unnamed protein product [Caenorhabditis brenneri]